MLRCHSTELSRDGQEHRIIAPRDTTGGYRRFKVAELPHVVECPIPGSGLRSRLDAIRCRKRCGLDAYAESRRADRAPYGKPMDVLLVHFGDEATARAFAAEFDLRRR